MTPFLQDAPIKRKLMVITLLTTSAALLLACAGFITYEQIAAREVLVQRASATARMLGDNSSAALSFGDAASAEQTLRSLYTLDEAMTATIYDREGKPFASYQGRTAIGRHFTPPPVETHGHRFGRNTLEMYRDIVLTGERVGTVYLRMSLAGLQESLKRQVLWTFGVLLTAAVVAWLLSARLIRVISGPIVHLAQVVDAVASEKNYAVRAVKQNNDELGRLIDGFNEMLGQIEMRDAALRDAHDGLEHRVAERTRELQLEVVERRRTETQLEHTDKQLVDASRRAGMAEVATNVLHNVGNVLNSVNISANLVAECLQTSRAERLGQVARLLEQHAADLGTFLTNDPRGRQIPAYLAQLADHAKTEQGAAVAELSLLRKHIDHIIEIVAMQQNYARVSGVREIVDVRELVQDSLRMNAGAMNRHGVAVEHEFGDVPKVSLDKHRALQILVNLVRNAKYACAESEQADKRVRLRVANGDGRIRISVSDNGVGISPENLTRIFSHGFTTRKDGHGFGLHSGALAAKEIGGVLTAHSDGPGKGATFTLEIPAH